MTLRRLLRSLGLCLALSVAALAAEPPAAVLQADEARVRAMIAADIAALDALLTRDCVYVHSNGSVQTKRALLAALQTGGMRYAAIRYAAPPEIRVYGPDAAVLTGTTHLEVKLADGRTLKPTLLVTAIYVRQDGQWRLASYQSTNAPAN